jgi:hypothetical protein
MAKDINIYIFIATCISSSENCVFYSFAHLIIGLLVLLLFTFLSSLYILDSNPLSTDCLAKIFSYFMGCLLILVIVSFDVWKLFSLMQSHLSILIIISLGNWPIQKINTYACIIQIFPYFFPVVVLKFWFLLRLLVHLELIFIQGEIGIKFQSSAGR